MVGAVGQEASEAERRLQVDGHEDGLASLPRVYLHVEERTIGHISRSLAEVAAPQLAC